MSSEIAVKSISIIQPPAQDAIGKRSNVEPNISTISPAAGKASVDSSMGKSLPNSGSDVPDFVLTGGANQVAQTQENSLSQEEVLGAVRNLNDFVQKSRRELNFSVDDQTGRTVVKVIDRETKEVIRQIPAEEVLAAARRFADEMDDKGNLFKVEV